MLSKITKICLCVFLQESYSFSSCTESVIHCDWSSGYDLSEGTTSFQLQSFTSGCPAAPAPFAECTDQPTGRSLSTAPKTDLSVQEGYFWTLCCTPWFFHLSCQSRTVWTTEALWRGSRSPLMPTFSSDPHLCLFWVAGLLWVSCISTWILESACQFLPKSQDGYWQRLYWICRSIWRVLPLEQLCLSTREHGMTFIYLDLRFFKKKFY